MADYWKSQPRKFCQYCKCWIADNKPSIEFHERGKNHKENVAAKISEIKKKSMEKAKQDKRTSKEFAKMEEAANKAYEEDLKRLEMEAQGLTYTAPAPAAPQPQKTPQPKKQKKKDKVHSKPREQTVTQVWVEGCSDEGLTYYYNTVTGESQWDKPLGFQGQKYPVSAPFQYIPRPLGYPWVEALSPEGYTYYYNTESGESSWEQPPGVPSSAASGSCPDVKGESKNDEEPQSSGEKCSDEVPETQEGEPPQQANDETKIRKRKAETEPSDKEDEFQASDEQAGLNVTKEECKTEEETAQAAAEAQTIQEKLPVKRRAINPYGAWEQIKQEQDPYAKVDLQLPAVEPNTTCAPAELPPEPKPKFKERVITSLGEQGGPASFRKTKTHNGKSRSLRQRDNDD